MSGPVDIAGDQLRTIVERIETIEGEIKELTEAKKEIFLEAKGNGFDVKVLREVIRVRKQDSKETRRAGVAPRNLSAGHKGSIAHGKSRLSPANRWASQGRPAGTPCGRPSRCTQQRAPLELRIMELRGIR